MAQRILLVNPIPKKQKKTRVKRKKVSSTAKRRPTRSKPTMATRKKRRRTAAQKAATRRLVAMNRRRRKPSRAPAKRKTVRRRRNPVVTAAAPVRRRRRPTRASAYRASSTRLRRRANPIRRGGQAIRMLGSAATATTGALALDMAWAYLPLPANVKSGPLKHVTKAVGAVALAYLAGFAVKKQTAEAMGVGAMSVVFHQAAREFIGRQMPALRMDGMGYYPQDNEVGYYPQNGLGYYNPALPAGTDSGRGAGEQSYYNQTY